MMMMSVALVNRDDKVRAASKRKVDMKKRLGEHN